MGYPRSATDLLLGTFGETLAAELLLVEHRRGEARGGIHIDWSSGLGLDLRAGDLYFLWVSHLSIADAR